MLFLFLGLPVVDDGEPGFLLMFWNVENFFTGRTHFGDKCNGIAKTVFLAADEYGDMPDIIGLAEVENGEAVRKLVNWTGLRRQNYGIIHFDSPDHRGIDCALLYRRSRFRLAFSKPCHLTDTLGRILPTRDILLVVLEPIASGSQPPEGLSTPGQGQGEGPAGDKRSQTASDTVGGAGANVESGVPPGAGLTGRRRALTEYRQLSAATAPIAVLVNHHPSKIGKDSDERRRIAMDRLYALRDSLLAEGISRIVAVGDFNDEVVPAAGVQAAYPEGSGTIKFQGKWEKIDGCPVLEGLKAREHIFAPPHLSTRDTRFSGIKPLRTFSGPRYLGGVSDHYPIILELEFVPENACKWEQSLEIEWFVPENRQKREQTSHNSVKNAKFEDANT